MNVTIKNVTTNLQEKINKLSFSQKQLTSYKHYKANSKSISARVFDRRRTQNKTEDDYLF